MVASLAACTKADSSSTVSANVSTSSTSSSVEETQASKPTKDRAGLEINVPDAVNTIVVLAPSMAQTVVDLGAGSKIIAVDQQSAGMGLENVSADLPSFDMVAPNIEEIISLNPDVVFASNLSGGGENPFAQLTSAGICVATIPTSTSIESIQEDISFIADVLGEQKAGEKVIAKMQTEIDEIAEIGKTIPADEQKTVYFEIAQGPSYSFGADVFLNEYIELIGAKNILAYQSGWLPVEEESAIALNPDVILTNVNYIDAPVGEILGRAGWANVTAVKNKEVYYIDNDASSLPNEFSVKALKEMAKAVYPEYYK